MDDPKFIIVPTGSKLMRDEEGNIISDGVIGRITEYNCYLTAYPKWPEENEYLRPRDLKIGECIKKVEYSLSGSCGLYDVYRVT
jgi:hypothetical protein